MVLFLVWNAIWLRKGTADRVGKEVTQLKISVNMADKYRNGVGKTAGRNLERRYCVVGAGVKPIRSAHDVSDGDGLEISVT